ncbi:stalk domain-containing protein [Marinicrinis lubricantis]|uniref:Stalk domain-containing protein n=1 Tax=Marinicrinis lubricantis TaxID=2086470 RepID=A0ABW1IL44_9BACL
MVKMNKIKTSLLVLAAATLSISAVASAAGQISKIEAYIRGDLKVKLNNEIVKLQNTPIVYENRTYVPLSEIADLVGVDVVWDGENKTIHINEVKPVPEFVEPTDYEEIQGMSFQVMLAEYGGRTYPVLTAYGQMGQLYYRVQDFQQMGYDIQGAKLAKEKWSDFWFVSKEEAQTFISNLKLSYRMDNETPVTGETNEKRMAVLRDYKPTIYYEYLGSDGYPRYDVYPGSPEVYMIDKVGVKEEEHEYSIFYKAAGKFYKTTLTLKNRNHANPEKEEDWYINSSQTNYVKKEEVYNYNTNY